MLVNLSNHPSKFWQKVQADTAKKEYGRIFDIDFPEISTDSSSKDIDLKAEQYFNKIVILFKEHYDPLENNAVHIMGEMTFVYKIVFKLKAHNIKCVASTTLRETKFDNDIKTSKFTFFNFREY